MAAVLERPPVERQASAIFERDRRGRPKYYRVDWDGVVLPKQPSLRLTEGETFFEQISNKKETKETKKRQNRFFDFVSRAGNLSASKKLHALSQDDCKIPRKRRASVPLRIRKLEIELTQRRLPRYPSQNHLIDPTFYPLASCELFKSPVVKAPEVPSDCPENDEIYDISETKERKRVSFSAQIEEDNTTTSTTEALTEYLENESTEFEVEDELIDEVLPAMPEPSLDDDDDDDDDDESIIIEEEEISASSESEYYEDESYYSESSHTEDYSEDEVSMEADDILQELMEFKMMHLQSLEQQDDSESLNEILEAEERIEESVSFALDESLSTIIDDEDDMEEEIEDNTTHAVDGSSRYYKPKYRTIGFKTENLREVVYTGENDEYLREVGYVSPLVRMMIFQARMELRCRKVSKEHKEELEPSLIEAIAMARATRLDECIIETRGTHYAKHDDAVIPSVVWVKGNETVSLPKFQEPTPPQFVIFKEAVALGGIKALKPEITTNYDPLASIKTTYDYELDVDDANKHKLIRTKYLTDMYLHDYDWRASDDDEDEESVHYESLDDVELPSHRVPIYTCIETKLDEQELKDRIAQQVAERVWERRYRLERPRAKQRIKYRCTCKYCKTSSTYQTFAYRKKWLVQQNLWKEPSVDDPADDSIEDTDLKKNSIRTTSTIKMSVGEAESGSECGGLQSSDEVSSDSSFPQSQSFESEKRLPSTSIALEGQRFDKKKTTFMNRSTVGGFRSLF
eukprot:CAMPEP_0116120336 /NCGR_PEP_ID=MMETSP0329-20121206/3121_1 /TAXON_ID=697910 /ORGANISM="Pseudo-nitzschia arenysensis, Strain B593" /LENGTH=744 /DNA_ID=CAMNT_0003614099 /DNA_START=6 /DNA_END=2240 /DNA_ORIENTATION=+